MDNQGEGKELEKDPKRGGQRDWLGTKAGEHPRCWEKVMSQIKEDQGSDDRQIVLLMQREIQSLYLETQKPLIVFTAAVRARV